MAPSGHEPMVDLQNTIIFNECFYLVVMEKLSGGSTVLHMWRLVISSSGELYFGWKDMHMVSIRV